MAKWQYEGINKDGKVLQGNIEASQEKEVRRFLRSQGIKIKRIIPPTILEFDFNEWLIDKGFTKPFSAKDLMNFTKQLSIMISAGVPIIQTLEILFKSQKQPVLKRSIKKMAVDIGEGQTIAESLEKQKGFPKLYCGLVKAGEAGGILDRILDKLTEQMDKTEKIKSQVKSAMTYPGIVSIVGIGVIYAMMVFVVPQFQDMLKDTGQELPAVTKFVIDMSNFFQSYSVFILLGVVLGFFFLSAWTKTPTGKMIYDRIIMKLPLFGGIVIKGNLSSFARTLSILLNAGVPLIDSLDICIETIDNSVMADDINKVKKLVVQGKNISDPLSKIDCFPDMMTSMIKIGEQTGRIDSMLIKVADVFEDEVNELVNNMTKLIEPLIIVVLGGFVATILVAMYLPIFMAAGGKD